MGGEDVNDELRFVSILRDPVNRTISYFYHALDEGWLDVEGCSDCCGSWWVDSSCSCEEYGYDNKYCCTEKLTFAERMATCNVTIDHWVDTQRPGRRLPHRRQTDVAGLRRLGYFREPLRLPAPELPPVLPAEPDVSHPVQPLHRSRRLGNRGRC